MPCDRYFNEAAIAQLVIDLYADRGNRVDQRRIRQWQETDRARHA